MFPIVPFCDFLHYFQFVNRVKGYSDYSYTRFTSPLIQFGINGRLFFYTGFASR